jgi:hypothetical protein
MTQTPSHLYHHSARGPAERAQRARLCPAAERRRHTSGSSGRAPTAQMTTARDDRNDIVVRGE